MVPSETNNLTRFLFLMVITLAPMVTLVDSLIVKTVTQGGNFSLRCSPSFWSFTNRTSQLRWFKDGNSVPNYDGIEIYSVRDADFEDSGMYSCQIDGVPDHGQQTKVIVGEAPGRPPKSVCLDSRTPMVTCLFYTGTDDGDVELCWEIANTNRYVWYSSCKEHVQNDSFTFILEEPGLIVTTTVSNEFGNISRSDIHNPIVQPDPPTITRLISTGMDEFNASFEIPASWDAEEWLNYEAIYIQNGFSYNLSTSFTRRTNEESFSFMVDRSPYSLVCLKVKVQNGMLGPFLQVDSLRWSNFSEPMCSYTPMAAPSRSAQIVEVLLNQSQTNPHLREVTLIWMPPPEEYRNGVIDHYELYAVVDNVTVGARNLSGKVTTTVVKDLESNELYVFRLYAWTKGRRSPPFVYVLHPVDDWQANVNPLMWMGVLMCSIFVLAILGRATFFLKEKMSSSNLPEPYFIPDAKVSF